MTRGRNDWPVSLETLTSVERQEEGGYSFTKSDGWSFFVPASEIGDFVPQVGDWVLMEQPVNNIATIIIEGRVIRHKSKADIEKEHKQMLDRFRLDKLERYIKFGDDLKARAKNLHPSLVKRMERFAAEGGTEFWIEDAGYEMACLEGATALVNAATAALPDGDDLARHQWVQNWETMNTKAGGYDYKGQMEMVPDFGDGHSGFTASAATGMAKMILEGKGKELE